MKKALKIFGKILLGLLILIAVFLIVMTIINQIFLKKEEKTLENYPGEAVEVDGHSLNVYVTGEGEHTLVFLPPSVDTTPVFTFEPLYTKLGSECKCAVVERFGYGMSDVVDTERDFQTIVRQDREALMKSGVEAPYILCPYSLSGLEALTWAQMFPDEVEGIVGIDMAFPDSFKGVNTDLSSTNMFMTAARKTGVIRLFVTDGSLPENETAEQKKMDRAIICRKYMNRCNVSEGKNIPAAIDNIMSGEKPNVPMYLFLTTGEGTGMSKEKWQDCAHGYTEGIANVQFAEFDCAHSEIIKKESEQMSAAVKGFAEGLDN